MSGEFTARERAMRRDDHQVAIAKTLFEWWWVRPNVQQYAPEWEKCDPEIQAFWMDGAWRVLRT